MATHAATISSLVPYLLGLEATIDESAFLRFSMLISQFRLSDSALKDYYPFAFEQFRKRLAKYREYQVVRHAYLLDPRWEIVIHGCFEIIFWIAGFCTCPFSMNRCVRVISRICSKWRILQRINVIFWLFQYSFSLILCKKNPGDTTPPAKKARSNFLSKAAPLSAPLAPSEAKVAKTYIECTFLLFYFSENMTYFLNFH